MDVSYDITLADAALLFKIVARTAKLYKQYRPDAMDEMDRLGFLTAMTLCHANGCPIDFGKLLAAKDNDFSHDVFGIARHVDFTTGKLTEGFMPRYAKVFHIDVPPTVG